VVLEVPVLSLWLYLLLCNVGLGLQSLQNLSVSGANSLVPHSLLTCLNCFLWPLISSGRAYLPLLRPPLLQPQAQGDPGLSL